MNAIFDKFKNKKGNVSFSDVAYDYLNDGSRDEDEVTDYSYELEGIFNDVITSNKDN